MLKSIIPALITFDGTLSSWWAKIAIGALLLIFVGLQQLVVMSANRRKGKEASVGSYQGLPASNMPPDVD